MIYVLVSWWGGEFIRRMSNYKVVQVDLFGVEVDLEDKRYRFLGVYDLRDLRRVGVVQESPGWRISLNPDMVTELKANRDAESRVREDGFGVYFPYGIPGIEYLD